MCVIGALTSDINTMDEALLQRLLQFGDTVVMWTASILEKGQKGKVFKPHDDTNLKAKMIMANLMAMLQIARIEKSIKSFDKMTQMMLEEFIINRKNEKRDF